MGLNSFSFAFPWAFLLLLISPLIIFFSIKSITQMPRWQKVLSTIWRLLLLTLFSVTLSYPSVKRETIRICLANLIDVSESVAVDSFAKASELVKKIEEKKPHDSLVLNFVFSDSAIPIDSNDISRLPSGIEGKIDRKKTNIVNAVSHAISFMPLNCSKVAVIITDGRDTENNPQALPDILSKTGVRIFAVPVEESKDSEVIVEEMFAPSTVKAGLRFSINSVVYSSRHGEAKVKLLDNNEKENNILLEEKTVTLNEGINKVTFNPVLKTEGKHLLKFEISPFMKEIFKNNNVFETAISVVGPDKILYIEGESDRGRHFQSALSSSGYSVKMESPGYLTTENLDEFDAIILSDVPYSNLPSGAFGKIKNFTLNGGVFIFAGGKNSYGMGGYRLTQFESFLPVSIEMEKEVEKFSSAIILVLDKSGSMTGLPLQMAKEAAWAAISALDPETLVEVISFDSAPKRLFHIQEAKNKIMMKSFISRIIAGGGTNIVGALQMAFSDIAPVRAKKKHIVLLTDGQSSKSGVESLLAKASGSGITITTVGLGSSIDRAFLEKIAASTGGKTYFTSDPRTLPKLFVQEVRVVSPSAVVEGIINVKVLNPSPFINRVGGAFPYLRGYNITTPKGGKAITYLASNHGHPILSIWKQGKGYAVAFTSDLKSRWAAPWVAWNQFGKFWSGLIKQLTDKDKPKTDNGGKINISVEGKKVKAMIDIIDEKTGEFINDAAGNISFKKFYQQMEKTYPLRQTAQGHYEAQWAVDEFGAYLINANISFPSGESQSIATSFTIPYPPEYRKLGPDRELLENISGKTDGSFAATPAKIWEKAKQKISYKQSIMPLLVIIILAMLIIDIAIRRLSF